MSESGKELAYGLARVAYQKAVWSWWRALLAVAVLLAVVWAVFAVTGHKPSPVTPAPSAYATLSVDTSQAATATPTVTPSPTPTVSTVRIDPAIPSVAVSFVTRWGRPGPGWLASLAPYTTPRLLRLLRSTRLENQPTVLVTGAPYYVTSADGRVQVAVPAGEALVTVTLMRVRGRWLVDQVDAA